MSGARREGSPFAAVYQIGMVVRNKEFLEKQGEGINHIGFSVDDLAAETAKLVGKGCRAVSSGQATGGGAFAYFDTDGVGGIIFELM